MIDELRAFGVTIQQCDDKMQEHADNCAVIHCEIANLKLMAMEADTFQGIVIKHALQNQMELLKRERSGIKKWRYYKDLLNGKTMPKTGIDEDHIATARQYDIVSLISEDIELKRVNGTFVARCPFHNEDTPSFYIKNNYYYCFGCGATGDTIKWLQEFRKMGFVEAVKSLS